MNKGWQSRIVGEGEERPDQLLANPRNWRIHPQSQQQALARLLDRVGWVQRVIVNQRTGHVVDGHLRVAMAISRGEPTVPVQYVDLSEDEEALVLASLDWSAGLAVPDTEMLGDILASIEMDGVDELLADIAAGFDIDLIDITSTDRDGQGVSSNAWLDELLTKQEIAAGDFLFPTNNEWGVPLLDIKLQANAVDMPVTKWGTMSRTGKMPGTWHFYTEDYKFSGLWRTPEKVLKTGCVNVVEPNFSTNEQMPLAVALWGVYRKRWLARYWQMHGIRVFVDVNVAQQAREINKLGVPAGWKAYFTRAYSDKPEWLEAGFADACAMRGDDDVLFVVYGGNQAIRDLAWERGWVWLPEDADTKMSSGRFLEDG